MSLKYNLKKRFRGFLPIVVDVETAGFNPENDALLEICAVPIEVNQHGFYFKDYTHAHLLPFQGAHLDKECLAFNKIDPFHPFRFAEEEKPGLEKIFNAINKKVKKHHCQRAVLVGHNAWFDLLFIKAAAKRAGLKLPFHQFTCIDTASLGVFCYGQTVLAKAMQQAGIKFNPEKAHSAIYDALKTAELFCHMVNEQDKKNSP